MRTTLSIDDHLLKQAKQRAASQHRSLAKFVEEALRQVLAREPAQRKPRSPVELPVSGEGGMLPGVDMDSTADLLQVMEKSDDSYGR